MRRIGAVIYKEFLHIIRDPRTLLLIFLLPVMELTIFGFAVNTDVKHLATILYDEDHSPLSRRLVEALEQSSYFDVNQHANSNEEVRKALDLGHAKAGLHIPPNFSRDVLAGYGGSVQMLIDGTDSNPANTALNTSQAIVSDFAVKEGVASVQVSAINFEPRLWYNPDLKNSYFLVPGLAGFLLQLLIPMITAAAIVREKELGNIEQLLVTPIKSYQLILGKIVPYMLIGMLIAVSVLLASRYVFHVPIRGNVLTLLALTMLFLIVALGLGLLASTVAQNQQQASQFVMFFAAPSVLLSGFIFPRETMPLPIYYLGDLIPLTFFLKIIRGIVLKGLGFWDLIPQILPLAAMAIFVLSLSIAKFSKRMS